MIWFRLGASVHTQGTHGIVWWMCVCVCFELWAERKCQRHLTCIRERNQWLSGFFFIGFLLNRCELQENGISLTFARDCNCLTYNLCRKHRSMQFMDFCMEFWVFFVTEFCFAYLSFIQQFDEWRNVAHTHITETAQNRAQKFHSFSDAPTVFICFIQIFSIEPCTWRTWFTVYKLNAMHFVHALHRTLIECHQSDGSGGSSAVVASATTAAHNIRDILNSAACTNGEMSFVQ